MKEKIKREMFNMTKELTETEFDLVWEVWSKHRDEYAKWVEEHGKEYLKEWTDEHGTDRIFNEEFAHFVCAKFMEWKSGKVEGV
jgi:hypothetical protein